MQQLRGRLYLAENAIRASDLSRDGRHALPSDDQSWHLLLVNRAGAVLGCTRFRQHSAAISFDDLGTAGTTVAKSALWGPKLRAAVEGELSTARASGFSYVEVGGWAMDPRVRGTAECLRSVLAIYAWSRLVGGAVGICTATERNGSAIILRKLGGHDLKSDGVAIPPYFDPRYQCTMHVLGFDSRRPNPRYEAAINQIAESLLDVPVISAEKPFAERPFAERPFAPTVVHNFPILREPALLRNVAFAL